MLWIQNTSKKCNKRKNSPNRLKLPNRQSRWFQQARIVVFFYRIVLHDDGKASYFSEPSQVLIALDDASFLVSFEQQFHRIVVKLMSESNDRVIFYRPKTAHSARSRAASSSRHTREFDRLTGVLPAKTVSVAIKELVPLLIDAAESNRNWLEDFSQDQVRIDMDLYEVLLAYQHIRRDEAA